MRSKDGRLSFAGSQVGGSVVQIHPATYVSWHPNPQMIVHRAAQFLSSTQIALGSLNRGMS